jgi:hypothetical protein
MTADREELLAAAQRGLRLYRRLILRNFVVFAAIAVGFALHDALWSRIVAALLLLAFFVYYVFVPWIRAGFVGGWALKALIHEAPERTVWLAVHQVPNQHAHLQVHDDDRHSWRLRLPPEEAAALIASWRRLAPEAHVSMASTPREVEWFNDPTAPRRWPKAAALELTSTGFRTPDA